MFNFLNAFLQAAHDATAGDVDGAGGLAEVLGDFLHRLCFDSSSPEGEPGLFGELPADLAGGPAEELAAVFGVDFCIVGFRLLLEAGDLGRASFADIRSFSAEGVDNRVSSNTGEPCAKAGSPRVGLPAIDRVGDRDQYGLGQILGVGVLHAAASGHAVNHGAVHGHKFVPRLAVGRISKLQQQAVTRFRKLVHKTFFSHQEHTHDTRRSFRSLAEFGKERFPGAARSSHFHVKTPRLEFLSWERVSTIGRKSTVVGYLFQRREGE